MASATSKMTMLVSTVDGVDLDAVDLGQALGEELGVGVVVGEPLDVVLEAVAGAGGDESRLAHRAAEHLLVAPGFRRSARRSPRGRRRSARRGPWRSRSRRFRSRPRRRRRSRPRRPSRSAGGRRRGGCAGRTPSATSSTSSIWASGQTRPPPRLVVCSTVTRRERGSWRSAGSRICARSASPLNLPPSPSSGITIAPLIAAAPPTSALIGWASRCRYISSPSGRMWRRTAIWLHIEPEGRKTAASLPSSSATSSQSALTVGSRPRCSSPTSAFAIAWRIASSGRVWVSE